MKTKNIIERVFFGLIVIAFVMFFVWSKTFPFGTGPDEPMRFCIPKFIYEFGGIPRGDDGRIIDSQYGISYAFFPIIGYLPCVIFMKIASCFSLSEETLYAAARFSSVLFSTGTAIVVTSIARKLFDDIYAIFFCVLTCFLPQFIYISSYVNLDSFGIFTVSLVILSLICAEENNWSIKNCIVMGISIGLCLLSYYNCFGIVVAAIVYTFYSIYRNDEIGDKGYFIIKRLFVGFLVVFLIAGWWYIRNAIIYSGDFLGFDSCYETAEKYAVDYLKPSLRQTPQHLNMSLSNMLFDWGWIRTVARSYVGVFDWMTLSINPMYYVFYFCIVLIGLTGNLVYGNNGIDKIKYKSFFIIAMLLMCIITISLSMYYSFYSDYQPQGRYLLPMLIPMNILIVNGLKKILEPRALYIQRIIMIGLSVISVSIAILCWTEYIIPFYS